MYNKRPQDRIPQEELVATIKKVNVFIEATGFFTATTTNGETILGVSATKPIKDIEVTLVGYWKTSPQWGKQFKVTAIRYESMKSAVLSLLRGGFIKHVGETMANSLYDTLGESVFTVMTRAAEGDVKSLLQFRSVKGVGKKNYSKILS